MPHVVLEGKANIDEFFNSFSKIFFRDANNSIIVRLEEILVNNLKTRFLIKATSIVNSIPRSYYISILLKGSSITIRLDELTDPEKNDGVKISLAILAKMFIIKYGLKVVRTNINEYLTREDLIV